MKNIYEATETQNYIIAFNAKSDKWELRGKAGGKTYFMASCKYQVPLIVKANKLEEARCLRNN